MQLVVYRHDVLGTCVSKHQDGKRAYSVPRPNESANFSTCRLKRWKHHVNEHDNQEVRHREHVKVASEAERVESAVEANGRNEQEHAECPHRIAQEESRDTASAPSKRSNQALDDLRHQTSADDQIRSGHAEALD